MPRSRSKGVTLVEVLVAFSIFITVITLVMVSLIQTTRSFREGERFADKEHKQRSCLARMGKTIASAVMISDPQKAAGIQGTEKSCFVIFAQAESLAEARYECNTGAQTLERFSEDPADYRDQTYQNRETCLESLSECSFAYYDGTAWKELWNQAGEVPKAVRLRFKFKDDTREHEFLANIPVSQ